MRKAKSYKPGAFDVSITFRITEKMVKDFFVSAIDNGGSSYWIKKLKPFGRSKYTAYAMAKGFSIQAYEGKEYITLPHHFRKGFERLAIEKPELFARAICGEFDMNSADTILQYIVFGKEKYG